MNTNQMKFASSNAPTSVPWLSAPVPLDQAGTGAEIAAKVGQGRAVLEIVSTPWGVEFYVCDVVGRP